MEDQQQILNQQLYAFRYLKEQRDFVAGQIEILTQSYNNLVNTKATLENLKNVNEGDEILIPIGGILNIKASVKEPEKCLFYIAKDALIEKNNDEAIKTIENFLEEHQGHIQTLNQNLQQIEMNLQATSEELQRKMPQQ